MKRVLAALLAVMLVMSASVTAFGATVSDVESKISSSIKYVDEGYGKDGYDLKNAKNLFILAGAGADLSKYEKGYFDAVSAALDAGELTGLDNLGLALNILFFAGIDAEDFAGYNLVEMFENTDISDNGGNPYYYAYAIEAAFFYDLDDYGKALCDKLTEYYIPGEGTDFWGVYGTENWASYGTSPDDIATFIIGLSCYAEDYEEYISDAFRLLETYNTDKGYDNGYGANADSTALALAAYSVTDNKEMADRAYDKLMLFYDKTTGGFKADYNPYYATADALYGMSFYVYLADEDAKQPTTDSSKPAANNSSTQTATQPAAADTRKTNDSKKSPNTGGSPAVAASFAAMALAGAAVLLSKKHSTAD